jgi:hypothetical protein
MDKRRAVYFVEGSCVPLVTRFLHRFQHWLIGHCHHITHNTDIGGVWRIVVMSLQAMQVLNDASKLIRPLPPKRVINVVADHKATQVSRPIFRDIKSWLLCINWLCWGHLPMRK